MSKFVQNFSSVEDICSCYGGSSAEDLEGATIHLAWYGYDSYDGRSLVVYEKDGKLFEVNGSHCSCNGLEDQWEPEETTVAALAMRDLSDPYTEGSSDAQALLTEFVNSRGGK
jgi:hypothetical protein